MKHFIAFITLLLLTSAGTHAHPRHGGAVTFGVFYSSLSPYGEWIEVEPTVYAWRPLNIHEGWRPYTVGSWAWTDDGWYWNTDEPWGWAAYHYGRWYYDDFYGWVWIPGYEWAPAWVEWRYGGNYIGWAPLTPYAVFSLHIGVYYKTHWSTPNYYWSFVDCRYITHRHVHKYVYRPSYNIRYIGRTRSSGSVRYDGGRIRTSGPTRDYVQQRGRIRVDRTDLMDVQNREDIGSTRTSDGRDRINVYRPRIDVERTKSLDRPATSRKGERKLDIDTRYTDATKPPRGSDREREDIRTQDRNSKPDRDRTMERPQVDNTQERSQRPSVESERKSRETETPRTSRRESVQQKPGKRKSESSPSVRQRPERKESQSSQREREVRPTERKEVQRSAPQRSGAKKDTRKGDSRRPPSR
ncbi:MAG TPA: DUF6600 domain-containing protein [Bacteroidota bacterium]